MALDVYRGRKTTIQQQQQQHLHCKKICRFYGKIPGNQLPVHIPLFLRASACTTFLDIKKW